MSPVSRPGPSVSLGGWLWEPGVCSSPESTGRLWAWDATLTGPDCNSVRQALISNSITGDTSVP